MAETPARAGDARSRQAPMIGIIVFMDQSYFQLAGIGKIKFLGRYDSRKNG
jgi:hypothetical protein